MSGVTGATARASETLFSLTLLEVRLLRDHLPGLILPAFIPAAEPTGAADETTQLVGVLSGLKVRQLVSNEVGLDDPDWSTQIPSTLLLALTLQMSGRLVFQVVAWSAAEGPGRSTTMHSSTVTETVCAGLTVRSTARAEDEPQVEVTMAPVTGLYPSLAQLLPADSPVAGPPVGDGSGRAVSLGILESRALIAAIRGGDHRVVANLTAELHAADSREVLQDLSGAMGTGYRIKAFGAVGDTAGGALFARDWFRGPRGWLKMSVALPRPAAGADAAQAITDQGRVTIRRTALAGIRQDLLGLVAETLLSSNDLTGATDAR
ncbi:hypothetical protein C3B59_00980 [Cryobacterium zongtaii]|uniref:ESX secretion-associated protein EspG n=1 Tax=Cryobacterium zongtaii TaxID=1259217 RepID=A0A2S3ZQB7_9MICO|nr:hypothetical protein [Cryobacterium zongtaii]POH71212.1 hypothetical protein C3B59_00980 [Cryobacterium zongtaii]